MTCAAWTPEGRRSCRSYVKRAFAVMLCCVLCLGLIQPPKSKAVAAEVGLVVAGSVAAAPVAATIGLICLAVVGVGFVQGAFDNTDSIYYGTAVYDWGYKFAQACENAGGAVYDWYVAQVAACSDGLYAGQQIEVPAEVAEYARQWAVQNIDFSSGAVTVTQHGIFSTSGGVIFTQFIDYVPASACSVSWVGSVINPPVEYNFIDSSGVEWMYSFLVSDSGIITFKSYRDGVQAANFSMICYDGQSLVFGLSSLKSPSSDKQNYRYLYPWTYDSATGIVNTALYYNDYSIPRNFMRVDDIANSFVAATMTKDPALDAPIIDDLVATIPDDIPFVQVGEKAISIPVISDLTREDVLTGEVVEPTVPPTTVPGEQTQVGDIALEDIKAQQASLGAVFISKFPFSIPWDFAAAVELLAAPPQTPHWEVDFFAPVAQRYGGWKGDTTIVIDFSDYEMLGQLCRWVTTIMFCSALISGTKRLIWTA